MKEAPYYVNSAKFLTLGLLHLFDRYVYQSISFMFSMSHPVEGTVGR
jgi:hypothetical protein